MNEKKLELYIHIPFCVKKCDYCDFLSFPADSNTQIRYVHALLQEIRYYGNLLGDYHVPTIYIGGGTPSWLEENLIYTVLQQVASSFHVESDAEISIECNPGTVTAKKLNVYQSAGINRLSIGLQSTNNEELKALGRIHTYDQFLKTYELARNAGFENINIDLMSGLPYQTLDKFLESLQTVIRLKPEHISAYSLIIEKGTPFYERYKFDAVKQEAGLHTEILPDEDEVYRIYKATQDVLKQAGYRQYEISNFARPGFESRHNRIYWDCGDYLGLGPAAHSCMGGKRFATPAGTAAFLAAPAVYEPQGECTAEDYIMLQLRLSRGLSLSALRARYGVSFSSEKLRFLQTLAEHGLAVFDGSVLRLTPRGMLVQNSILCELV